MIPKCINANVGVRRRALRERERERDNLCGEEASVLSGSRGICPFCGHRMHSVGHVSPFRNTEDAPSVLIAMVYFILRDTKIGLLRPTRTCGRSYSTPAARVNPYMYVFLESGYPLFDGKRTCSKRKPHHGQDARATKSPPQGLRP